MKRTVSVRDDEGEDAADDGPEHKRVKEEADQPEAVLELSVDDFECVICCDLMVEPVVSKCGHDFCKFCLEQVCDNARKKYAIPSCPVCRTPLAGRGSNADLGVCIRIKEMIERLFPRRSKQRKAEVEKDRERERARAAQEATDRAAAAAAAGPGRDGRGYRWAGMDDDISRQMLNVINQAARVFPYPHQAGLMSGAARAGLSSAAAAAAAAAGGDPALLAMRTRGVDEHLSSIRQQLQHNREQLMRNRERMFGLGAGRPGGAALAAAAAAAARGNGPAAAAGPAGAAAGPPAPGAPAAAAAAAGAAADQATAPGAADNGLHPSPAARRMMERIRPGGAITLLPSAPSLQALQHMPASELLRQQQHQFDEMIRLSRSRAEAAGNAAAVALRQAQASREHAARMRRDPAGGPAAPNPPPPHSDMALGGAGLGSSAQRSPSPPAAAAGPYAALSYNPFVFEGFGIPSSSEQQQRQQQQHGADQAAVDRDSPPVTQDVPAVAGGASDAEGRQAVEGLAAAAAANLAARRMQLAVSAREARRRLAQRATGSRSERQRTAAAAAAAAAAAGAARATDPFGSPPPDLLDFDRWVAPNLDRFDALASVYADLDGMRAVSHAATAAAAGGASRRDRAAAAGAPTAAAPPPAGLFVDTHVADRGAAAADQPAAADAAPDAAEAYAAAADLNAAGAGAVAGGGAGAGAGALPDAAEAAGTPSAAGPLRNVVGRNPPRSLSQAQSSQMARFAAVMAAHRDRAVAALEEPAAARVIQDARAVLGAAPPSDDEWEGYAAAAEAEQARLAGLDNRRPRSFTPDSQGPPLRLLPIASPSRQGDDDEVNSNTQRARWQGGMGQQQQQYSAEQQRRQMGLRRGVGAADRRTVGLDDDVPAAGEAGAAAVAAGLDDAARLFAIATADLGELAAQDPIAGLFDSAGGIDASDVDVSRHAAAVASAHASRLRIRLRGVRHPAAQPAAAAGQDGSHGNMPQPRQQQQPQQQQQQQQPPPVARHAREVPAVAAATAGHSGGQQSLAAAAAAAGAAGRMAPPAGQGMDVSQAGFRLVRRAREAQEPAANAQDAAELLDAEPAAGRGPGLPHIARQAQQGAPEVAERLLDAAPLPPAAAAADQLDPRRPPAAAATEAARLAAAATAAAAAAADSDGEATDHIGPNLAWRRTLTPEATGGSSSDDVPLSARGGLHSQVRRTGQPAAAVAAAVAGATSSSDEDVPLAARRPQPRHAQPMRQFARRRELLPPDALLDDDPASLQRGGRAAGAEGRGQATLAPALAAAATVAAAHEAAAAAAAAAAVREDAEELEPVRRRRRMMAAARRAPALGPGAAAAAAAAVAAPHGAGQAVMEQQQQAPRGLGVGLGAVAPRQRRMLRASAAAAAGAAAAAAGDLGFWDPAARDAAAVVEDGGYISSGSE